MWGRESRGGPGGEAWEMRPVPACRSDSGTASPSVHSRSSHSISGATFTFPVASSPHPHLPSARGFQRPAPTICQMLMSYWIPMKVLVIRSCPTLCHPMECSPPGSSVHGTFQARVLEQVAISFSRGSSWPRDHIAVFRAADRFFTIWATRETPWP